MNSFRILIATDYPDSARSLASLFELRGDNADVIDFPSIDTESALEEAYNLVLIDLYDPNLDPRPTGQCLRQKFSGPILLMTYEGDERFHLHAYEAGVDESIIKPVGMELLLAKAAAWANRAHITKADKPAQQHGFSVNGSNRQVRTPTGDSIRLSKLEYNLLCLFLDHPNRILESRHIVDRVWYYQGIDADTEMDDLVKNLVYRLRRKIETEPSTPQYIQTVPHVGYVFSLP